MGRTLKAGGALAGLLALAGCAADGVGSSYLERLLASSQRPAEADAYSAYLAARYASLTDDPRRAADFYETAQAARPGDRALTELSVFAAQRAGAFQQAVRLAERGGGAAAPDMPLSRLSLAVDALRRGDPQRAEALLAGAAFGPFNRTLARQIRAWAVLETRGLEAARLVMAEAPDEDPLLRALDLYTQATLAMVAGEDTAALAHFAAASANGPRLAAYTELHARLLAARGATASASAVIAGFHRETCCHPGLQRLDDAISAGAAVGFERPDTRRGAALSLFALAAALAGETESPLPGVYFSMVLALDPDLHAARLLWAGRLAAAGQYAMAIDLLAAVPEAAPAYPRARAEMAWALYHAGEPASALEVAKRALAEAPGRALESHLADLFVRLGRDGEAEAIYSGIIAADAAAGRPDWRLLFARGAARERLGRWPEARIDLEAALALDPDNPDILNHLGYGLVERSQDLEKGFRLLRRAVDLDPDSGYIADSLGWAYFKAATYERAVYYLERAAALEPANPIINEHLGDAYWRAGRRLEAHFQWRRALGLLGEDRAAAALREKLAAGLPEPLTAPWPGASAEIGRRP